MEKIKFVHYFPGTLILVETRDPFSRRVFFINEVTKLTMYFMISVFEKVTK